MTTKIVKNNTGSPVNVSDVGTTIPANSQYTIQPYDYLLWAASGSAVTLIGAGTLIVNDGSGDLSITDGMDLIKGVYQKSRIIGDTTGALIGNVTDRLKVIDPDVISAITGLGGSNLLCNILRNAETAVTSRNEFDFGTSYTVPTGKKFSCASFSGSYDAQAALYIRFKKQTGGTGSFVTIFRLNMMSGGQGNSTLTYDLSNGILVGDAGDVFKMTVESSIAKGTVAAHFAGVEF